MTPFDRRSFTQLAFAAAAAAALPPAVRADPTLRSTSVTNEPARDFDFFHGSWRVQHRRLKERLAGSRDWIELDGVCVAGPTLAGNGNVDDNIINLPGSPYRAATMRSYNPATKTWAIWWFDERFPHAHGVPVIGGFKDGVGQFFSDETFNDKPIKVRFTWSKITPTSAQWDQAFSPDAGRTWETNWVMNFERTGPALASGSAGIVPALPLLEQRTAPGVRDFDSHAGRWRARHRRLKERLAGSSEWIDFEGTCTLQPLLGGAANMDDNFFNFPPGPFRGVSMRMFDPKTQKWAIWWLDSRYPHTLDPPMVGAFNDGEGLFFADETFKGMPIRVRFIRSKITPDRRSWAQAFSPDGGRTWETNWTSDFERV